MLFSRNSTFSTAKEPPGRSTFTISEWDKARGQQTREVNLHHTHSPEFSNNDDLVSAEAEICFIFPSANKIRECESCRAYFIDRFQMPEQWWSDSTRKSNGYFGCHPTSTHTNTWAYFEMKLLEGASDYRWYKLNAFIRWDKATHQTIVLSFDTPAVIVPRFLELLQTPDPNILQHPFWFYPHLLSEIARLQESAVWAVRDQVRAVEKRDLPEGRPDPNYRELHDMARHAIHVSETLDVAVQTIERMLRRHKDITPSLSKENGSQTIHSEIQFFESFISSLRHRSISNEKRMVNEIQLAFNTVAQHDASTSVKIGLATQSDSDTMKSIAFVTLTFLPPTFVSAIFSMSFFDFSADSGWAISDKFWLYWAFAVPTTFFTAAAWFFLRQHRAPASPGGGEKRRKGILS